MTDLSDFGGGVDRPETESEEDVEEPSDDSDRADGAEIDDQCRAITDDGERCENAITHMSADPVCGPHDRAEDVTLIEEVNDDG